MRPVPRIADSGVRQAMGGATVTNTSDQPRAELSEEALTSLPPGPEDLARAAALCDRLVHETEGLVLEALEVSGRLFTSSTCNCWARPLQEHSAYRRSTGDNHHIRLRRRVFD